MSDTHRQYTFDQPISLAEAQRLVRLALDDEGLQLLPRGARHDDVWLGHYGSRVVVMVPESRIAPR